MSDVKCYVKSEWFKGCSNSVPLDMWYCRFEICLSVFYSDADFFIINGEHDPRWTPFQTNSLKFCGTETNEVRKETNNSLFVTPCAYAITEMLSSFVLLYTGSYCIPLCFTGWRIIIVITTSKVGGSEFGSYHFCFCSVSPQKFWVITLNRLR